VGPVYLMVYSGEGSCQKFPASFYSYFNIINKRIFTPVTVFELTELPDQNVFSV